MDFGNFRGARLIQVLETHVLEGNGTKSDLYRVVIYYSDPENGKLLAKYDYSKGERI